MNSDDQFKVFYQPLVNAQSGRIIGAEALVRWFNPTRGLVPPDRFIPLAESNGLIVPMGRKILATACADGARFRKHIGSDFFMAVNVAAAQCADPGFLETVSKCLSDAKLPPHCLEVEITERTVVGNNPTITAFMTALREAESKLSIDDFGTGYSALAACYVDPSPSFWDGLTRFLGPVPSIWSPSWVLRRRGPFRITG